MRESQSLFRDSQPDYAARGIALFPLRPGQKVPAIKNWQKLGLAGSSKLAAAHGTSTSFGFALGKASKVSVLDIDSADERVVADAFSMFGKPKIVVRSGSGHFQGWFQWRGEPRAIRPIAELPIDMLGGGFVVAPPSAGKVHRYEFIEGRLDDIHALTRLTKVPNSQIAREYEFTAGSQKISRGNRNNMLFRFCMRTAPSVADQLELERKARSTNQMFVPPLADEEVQRTVESAWRYQEKGMNRFGRGPGAFFTVNEVDSWIDAHQDAFLLLAFLRAHNAPARTFFIANGIADRFRWCVKRLRAARNYLLHNEVVVRVSAAHRGGPATYRWGPTR